MAKRTAFKMTLLLAITMSVTDLALSQEITGNFTLERVDASQWRATYVFDREITGFQFDRSVSDYQKTAWKFDDIFELILKRDSDGDDRYFLQRRDGGKFGDFSIKISSYQKRIPKDYLPFSTFTGGGSAVYVGYFDGLAYVDNTLVILNWIPQYVGASRERVIAADQSKLGSQFVYFGNDPIQSDKYANLIIDSAMPDEIVSKTKRGLADVNEALAEIFSIEPLSKRYGVMLAGANIGKGRGSSSQGGVVDKQVMFTYSGEQVLAHILEEPNFLPIFVAHEVIHLWQNDLWPQLGGKHPWMHEGNAEAMALELLKENGVISQSVYKEERDQRMYQCFSELRETSVDGGPSSGKFDIVYSCGASIHFLIADALSGLDERKDMFTLWHAMAKRPLEDRKQDGKLLYYSVLKENGLTETQLKALDDFLATQSNEPKQSFQKLKATLGL